METKCKCGCPYSRHYDDPIHYGEKLGCVDCGVDCKQYEEEEPS
jgi:hypothetical protein